MTGLIGHTVMPVGISSTVTFHIAPNSFNPRVALKNHCVVMNSLFQKADKFVTTGINAVTNSLAAKNTNNENPPAFAPTEDVAPLRTEDYYAKKPPSTEIPVAAPVPVPNKPPVVVVHPPTNMNTTIQSTAPVRRPVSHSPEEPGFGCKCDCCNACFSCFGSCFKSLIPPAWFLTSAFCTVGLILSSSVFAACDFIHYQNGNEDEDYSFSDLCPNELVDLEGNFSLPAKGAAILSIVLGGICLFLMMAPCLLCCCFRAMNKRQWRQCGCLLAVAGILQLFTLIAILDCGKTVCTLAAGGFRALPASFCLSGAAVSSYFVNENESRLRNTVLVQRTVNQGP